MDSSTLPSKVSAVPVRRLPLGALRILLVAGLTLAASAYYCIKINPEIAFFKAAALVKRAWARELTYKFKSKVVMYGGSSCAFSIDAERMLREHKIPLVNMGLAAGMKPTMLTNWALSETSPGDTLIIAVEPGLLSESLDPTSMSVQFSAAMGAPEWINAPWLEHPLSPVSKVLSLRPGGLNVVAMMGKLLGKAPLYRYTREDIHPGGWLTTSKRIPPEPMIISEPIPLPKESRAMLQWIRQWAEANNVRVAYSLPWYYTDQEHEKNLQRSHRALLKEIAKIIPVLKDPHLGACTRLDYYADTLLHLTPEASAIRTDELAQQIKHWTLWTSSELSGTD